MSTLATIDRLLGENRALLARNAELEQQLADERADHYRQAWAAVTQALDQARPNWRDSGPTALTAAVTTIMSATDMMHLAGFLVARGEDAIPVLTVVAAKAYEKRGYAVLPMYMR